MPDMLTQFENDLLQKLLTGEDETLSILRTQVAMLSNVNREMTGVGFYLNFMMPSSVPPIHGFPNFNFGDVLAEIEGLTNGAGFVLFVERGVLTMLEGYSYDEPWPSQIKAYRLYYASGNDRDISALRKRLLVTK